MPGHPCPACKGDNVSITKVLIVGGGIGGLTTAIALHRKGIAADVIERDPNWSVYGVGIIQPSNVLRALRDIGLGDACVQNGRGFQGWRFCDAQGHPLAEGCGHNVLGDDYPPINGIRRPALHKILTEATLAQGTSVRLGVTLASWTEDNEGVEVEFSDGSAGRYDLIIGADGAYSQLRNRLFGDSVMPRFTGQGVWRHNFERPRDLDWGMVFFGAKSKAGLVPLSDSLMYLFIATPEPGNPRHPADQLHLLLKERLAEYGGILRQLREQIDDPANVVYRPMEVLMLPQPWHKGRVVLIGDSAHSSTPHLAEGAGMAIEDSVLLADMLAAGQDDLDAVLSAFAQRRLPRAKLVYDTSLTIGEWEMAQWNGQPHGDIGALMNTTYTTLMQNI
nr:FAD-dependent oxidoreductase [Pseudomonas aeruginosa]